MIDPDSDDDLMVAYLYAWHQRDAEVARLNECCTRRGARLQILRESLRMTDWLRFLDRHPEAKDWFDDDGVPL